MSTQIELLKADIARLEARLEETKRKLAKIEAESSNGSDADELPFNKLRGIWKGANFTQEEIDAAKIKVRDFPD
jgi:predicted  nucleic acid-binding Zn-ribbon protein